MHGGPGADHWTLLPFRQLSDRFTLVFYDHRCNGRSVGVPVASMTQLLAKRGFSRRKGELARRWFNGQTAPWQFFPTLMRLGGAYDLHTILLSAVRTMFSERRTKARPQAEIFGFGQLMKGWTVMDRLGEIRVPTLVMAGRDDFVFPRSTRVSSRPGSPNARREIIERAGHNPHDERTAEVMKAVRDFIPADVAVRGEVAPAVT
jgi:proline iminopeptidase